MGIHPLPGGTLEPGREMAVGDGPEAGGHGWGSLEKQAVDHWLSVTSVNEAVGSCAVVQL